MSGKQPSITQFFARSPTSRSSTESAPASDASSDVVVVDEKNASSSSSDIAVLDNSSEPQPLQHKKSKPDADSSDEEVGVDDLVWDENPEFRIPAVEQDFAQQQLLLEEGGAVEADNEDNYEVEEVLGVEKKGNREMFLLKWKGWDYDYNTKEPRDNLDCPEAMHTFRKRTELREAIFNAHKIEEAKPSKAKNNKTVEAKNPPLDLLKEYKYPEVHLAPKFRKAWEWERELNKKICAAGQAPLYVENWSAQVQDDTPEFTFMLKNLIPPQTAAVMKPTKEVIKCDCEGGCKRHEAGWKGTGCEHIKAEGNVIVEIPKNLCCWEWKGYIPSEERLPKNFNSNLTVVECCDECACDITCPSRVVQRGRQIPVVLFRSDTKGWCLLAGDNIPRGTFVMEYVGEVITRAEADTRDQSYQYDMGPSSAVDAKGEAASLTQYVVDAKHFGNEARFANHSCDPNLRMVPVFRDNIQHYNIVAYYAKKDIARGDELTVDYYEKIDKDDYKKRAQKADPMNCMCGSKRCRKDWL